MKTEKELIEDCHELYAALRTVLESSQKGFDHFLIAVEDAEEVLTKMDEYRKSS